MQKEEKRITLDEIVEKHGLTLWSTTNTTRGKTYQYIDFDGINIIINEWDKSFQLKWNIPESIMMIECPNCSPYDHPVHFERMYKRFKDIISVYECGLNYM